MPVQKLQTVDGFVVRDFADTPSSGVVRRGRKILQRSATDLARSATYAFAFNGIRRGGASAGLNAEGDDESEALTAAVAELRHELVAGRLELLPAKGIEGSELAAALAAADGDSADDGVAGSAEQAAPLAFDDRVETLGAGVLAAAAWALGGSVEGRRVFIEGDSEDPVHQALTTAVTSAGATVVEARAAEGKPWAVWATEADAILVGSRPGAMNHQGAELLNVSSVIPWAPLPITTKALAVMIGRGITYVPDFISAAGPLVAGHLDPAATPDDRSGRDGARFVTTAVEDGLATLDTSSDPLFIAACGRAESFLATWQDKLPFGRPLAG